MILKVEVTPETVANICRILDGDYYGMESVTIEDIASCLLLKIAARQSVIATKACERRKAAYAMREFKARHAD